MAYTFRSINKNQLGWHLDMGGQVLDGIFGDGWMENGYKYNFLLSCKLNTAENVVGIEKKDWPVVALLITTPEGETRQVYKAYPPNEFKAESWGVTIGNNVFKGSLTPEGLPAGYEVKMDLDDVCLDITAKAICTGVRFVEDEHGFLFCEPTTNIGVGWWPLVPRASVEGTLRFQGKKTQKAAGLGYCERQLGNNEGRLMSDWVSHWCWGHFWAGDYTAVWTYASAPDMLQYRPFSPLVLWKGSDIILCTHNLSLSPDKFEYDHATGVAYPTVETIHATQGNIELLGLVSNPTLTERHQMFNLPGQTLENAGCVFRGFADIDIEITRLDRLEIMSAKCMYEHGQIT